MDKANDSINAAPASLGNYRANPQFAARACNAMADYLDQLARQVRTPYDFHLGICYNLKAHMRTWEQQQYPAKRISRTCYELVQDLAVEWPEHSGDPGYPIEPPRYGEGVTLWTGEPGKARRRLAAYLSTQLRTLATIILEEAT